MKRLVRSCEGRQARILRIITFGRIGFCPLTYRADLTGADIGLEVLKSIVESLSLTIERYKTMLDCTFLQIKYSFVNTYFGVLIKFIVHGSDPLLQKERKSTLPRSAMLTQLLMAYSAVSGHRRVAGLAPAAPGTPAPAKERRGRHSP